MDVVRTVTELRERVGDARRRGRTVGLVPTMGAMHAGHASLVRRARAENGYVVVSIFVNPTQFGPSEDLDKYPRDMVGDSDLCEKEGVDLIFAPTVQEMYPDGFRTYVTVEGLSEVLCGASRPGHFRGVTTVVAKLFNQVGPDKAYFGRKDVQQAVIIQRMVRDLDIPVEIVVCPTVRDNDGLALSSRNSYLSPEERKQATVLYRALSAAQEMFTAGRHDPGALLARMKDIIASQPLVRPDYLRIVDSETLEDVQSVCRGALVTVAAHVGGARLIDNITLE